MSRPGTAEQEGLPEGEARNGILARINEREREIERQIQEAHETAAARVAEARRAAAELLSDRGAEADLLAARAGERIIELTRREAGGIREEAARDAAVILSTPRERIELAADRLLALVLPRPADAEGRP